MRMDEDGSDLIEGDKTDGPAFFFDFQKATITRKVAAVLTDVNDLVQSAAPTEISYSINLCGESGYFRAGLGGPGSFTFPISSTITRRTPDFIRGLALIWMNLNGSSLSRCRASAFASLWGTRNSPFASSSF